MRFMAMDFEAKESLLRAAWPNYIKSNGSISSAAFKPRKLKDDTIEGVSTDRTCSRTMQESVEFMEHHIHSDSRIISVSVADCNEIKLYLKYSPSSWNKYHTEIYSKAPNIPLENI